MGISVKCCRCGESFAIGEDAFIVRDEDRYAALFESGVRTYTLVGRSTRVPDLIAHYPPHFTPDKSKKEEELAKVPRIRESITRDESRQWRCGNCKATNEYSFLSP